MPLAFDVKVDARDVEACRGSVRMSATSAHDGARMLGFKKINWIRRRSIKCGVAR